jgi:phenylalanyl-tRNA synthetase alpha chain
MKKEEIEDILLKLSPLERDILPFLELKNALKISSQAKLNLTSVKRALQFLSNKGLVTIEVRKRKVVKLGNNGVIYLKNHLPERRLLDVVASAKKVSLNDAKKEANLSNDEFQIALGVLKQKAMVEIKAGNLVFKGKKEQASKLMLEEKFLAELPLDFDKLNQEQKLCLKNLKNRRDIVKVDEVSQITFEITETGKKILESLEKLKKMDLIEELSPELIRKGSWRGKKFRKYDIKSKLPEIYGGKRHFVNQAMDYARKIWLELGFQEMQGTMTQTCFWNFDALFTAQDHSVREMQDTFYLKGKGKLPEKKLVQEVKKAHEQGIQGSKGWNYRWQEQEAKKIVLRTHTTCLSAQTLAKLRTIKEKTRSKQEIKGKYFALGKCFRNETVDWSHGFEFNQTEGIVIDKDANFKHLLGYLREFYKKMGFEKIRFAPAYFPYTEPSVEISAWNSEKKVWLELGGAGIFRPEVVIPLLGEYIPVLAWGPGFDRAIMEYYEIKDLREMYKNDINKLRKMKFWLK